MAERADDDVEARVLAWRHGAQAAVCDVVAPWAHGTVLRATRFPDYFDFNAVRVEEPPDMGVDDLIAVADDELEAVAHRRVDFDRAEDAAPYEAEFAARGWMVMRLLWLRLESPPPPPPDLAVEEVPYDEVYDLRVRWHGEDFPDVDPTGFQAQAREVAMRRGVQVLAVREDGRPVSYAQLERDGDGVEVTSVYVHPDRRGGGRGTAMTLAAIAAAGDARDVWISADDDDRPKELYQRLGFRPVTRAIQFLRLP